MGLDTATGGLNRDPRREALVRELHDGLHALCQPLTALQCLLELGQMAEDREGLREAVDGGLVETRRIFLVVARIRRCLRAEEAAAIWQEQTAGQQR